MFDSEIAALQQELEEIYCDFHRHPEPGLQEFRTSRIVAQKLTEYGLDVTSGVGVTGVVGILDSGKPGKTLMLRADMDCLPIQEQTDCSYRSETPGMMHACGHDAHTTMLLGAAKILSSHTEAFSGKIKFVFQPDEEGRPDLLDEMHAKGYTDMKGGADAMIHDGVLDGVDECLVLHVQPNLPSGVLSIAKGKACASSDYFKVEMVGKGGHGANPQHAIDPVPAIGELISAIHLLPAREISALDTCVISIGNISSSSNAWNVISDTASLEGGFRAFNDETRAHLAHRIHEISEHIAAANRCKLHYEHMAGYAPVHNFPALAEKIASYNLSLLGEDRVILTDEPMMGSEDCGSYFRRVPGVFMFLGIGTTENDPPLHNPSFRMNLAELSTGTAIHVNNAICLLNDGK